MSRSKRLILVNFVIFSLLATNIAIAASVSGRTVATIIGASSSAQTGSAFLSQTYVDEITESTAVVTSKETKIDNLVNFLKKYKSPIAQEKYAKIIIETSEKYGADYRINVGIMLAESGLCVKPVKKYNCYGYLNGVQYKSFDAALTRLTEKVSKQYTSKYGWDIDEMGKAYGVHNVPAWAKNVNVTKKAL